MNDINICITPELLYLFPDKESTVVVVDILRATSSICSAFHNGVKEIIPVASLEIAFDYKKKGFLVAAERDGKIVDFADFGNSPRKFSPLKVKTKTIVFSSTNGTPAIKKAEEFKKVLIGSFLNIKAIANYLIADNRNVIILCSGWKGNFSMEDILFAGAVAELLTENNRFSLEKDIVQASLSLWKLAKYNINAFLTSAEHVNRLCKLGAEKDIEYCLKINDFNEIPVYSKGIIKKMEL